MFEYRITHVRKLGGNSPHEFITHVGNLTENWIFTKEEAINMINSCTNKFYVIDDNSRYDVGIYSSGITGPSYLRTFQGKYWYDHLLALPQYELQHL